MKILRFIILAFSLLTILTIDAQDFKKNTFSASLGAPVSPLSKSGTIAPMGRFGVTYYRNLPHGWQVGLKLEWNNWSYKTIESKDYPIVIDGKNTDSHTLLGQSTLVPQIVARYKFRFGRFLLSPGLYGGIEIPFNASKDVYLKPIGSNELIFNYLTFKDNKVNPMLCGTLKVGFVFNPHFTIALEGGYNKTFGTKSVANVLYNVFKPGDIRYSTHKAQKLHSWPIMITADISF